MWRVQINQQLGGGMAVAQKACLFAVVPLASPVGERMEPKAEMASCSKKSHWAISVQATARYRQEIDSDSAFW